MDLADGDGRDRAMAAEAIAGCDAVIHIPPIVPPHAAPAEIADAGTRSTYNLIMAAPAGCRIVPISNLSSFERYPVEYPVKAEPHPCSAPPVPPSIPLRPVPPPRLPDL